LEVEDKSAVPYSSKKSSQRPREVEDIFSSPFSLKPLWTLARTRKEEGDTGAVKVKKNEHTTTGRRKRCSSKE
jgi:hypothetical protein